MKLQNIKIDNEAMLKNAILINAVQYYAYENGKKLDTVEGSRLEIVLVGAEFEKIQIKVKNIFLEEKDIQKSKPVYFKNCVLKLRQDFKTGEIICYGEAEAISQEKPFNNINNNENKGVK